MRMINKNELKYIQSFAHKKHWAEESVFIIEGPKMMEELMASNFVIRQAYATKEWVKTQPYKPHYVTEVADFELDKLTQLQKANQVIALVEKKQIKGPIQLKCKMTLCLDGIQDPGNLGTIIRTADWFGLDQIVVSADTASCYNPKVVQSTMGSILRVDVIVADLPEFIQSSKMPIYGAVLEGKSIQSTTLAKEGILVIGNESKGIRTPILSLITDPITIPKYGHAESLNAAVATGIILANWQH
ncbi:MAG: RNA methyltransferase [Chitinophagia bacterium]|jgi:TrmH family RNA methyltransferase|nr:RNA methyltransferase [Chitinophagia bacterium]